MSLLSLLIALAVERSLATKAFRFSFYYQHYQYFFSKNVTAKPGQVANGIFILLPVLATLLIVDIIDNPVFELLFSTLVLIVCFGCNITRASYKNYLYSAFKGERTTATMHHQQLLSDKNLPDIGFGQALVWLNYRYYIVIMLYFTVLGPAGAVFYRMLTSVIEDKKSAYIAEAIVTTSVEHNEAKCNAVTENDSSSRQSITDQQNIKPTLLNGCQNYHHVLFWIDWLPVRIASFGYMFVGHFSKAMPVWLESLFDNKKSTHEVLISVAESSEDIIVNKDDFTEEPCLLVRLAKRNVLFIFSVISLLTLAGLIH